MPKKVKSKEPKTVYTLTLITQELGRYDSLDDAIQAGVECNYPTFNINIVVNEIIIATRVYENIKKE